MYSKAQCDFPRRREKGRGMEKELSKITLEELWELFPIFLVEHKDAWDSRYDEMEARLRHVLSECPVKVISHVGSTAIPGIWTKDIVDILVEIAGLFRGVMTVGRSPATRRVICLLQQL